MKRLIYLLIFLCFAYIVLAACPQAMNGDGSLANPCQVTNCTQLQAMNDSLTYNYSLSNNIECSATRTWNSGAGFKPIGVLISPATYIGFSGTLIGNNHTISNIYITGGNNVGVFGIVTSASFYDFKLSNVSISGSGQVGGLAGYCNGVTIKNCSVHGIVQGTDNVGGIVGLVYSATINQTYFNGNVTGTGSTAGGVGGLIGQHNSGKIDESYSIGKTTGVKYVGGISGYYSGSISNSFSTSVITASTSNGIGGLVGWNNGGAISNSYYNNITENRACAGTGSSSGCTAIQNQESYFFNTSEEPMNKWDFNSVWSNRYNTTNYPILKWQSDLLLTPPTILFSLVQGSSINITWATTSGTINYLVCISNSSAFYVSDCVSTTSTSYLDTTAETERVRYYSIIANTTNGLAVSNDVVVKQNYTIRDNTANAEYNNIHFYFNMSENSSANDVLTWLNSISGDMFTQVARFNPETQSMVWCTTFTCPPQGFCTDTTCDFNLTPGMGLRFSAYSDFEFTATGILYSPYDIAYSSLPNPNPLNPSGRNVVGYSAFNGFQDAYDLLSSISYAIDITDNSNLSANYSLTGGGTNFAILPHLAYTVRVSQNTTNNSDKNSVYGFGWVNGTVQFINITVTNNISFINETVNANTLFKKNLTLTWNQTKDVISNVFYKQRYSIYNTGNTTNSFSMLGYTLNDSSATLCEINNIARTVSGSYCNIRFTVNKGDTWPLHYYWDDKLGTSNAVTMRQEDMYINSSISFYHRITVDYNYPERAGTAVKINKGWNLISLSGFEDDDNAVNVSLSKGWNQIGYPSNQTIKMSDILYINTTGEVLTLDAAAALGYIQRTFYYYYTNSTDIASNYINLSGDSEIFENMGFWVYINAPHCSTYPAKGRCADLQFPHGPDNDTFFPYSSVNYIYNGNYYTPAEAGTAGLIQTTIYGYSAGYTYYPPLDDMSAWKSFWIYSYVNDLMLTANNGNITSDDYIPANVNTFTNVTVNFYYDSQIDSGQKLQYYTYINQLPVWYDITLPTATTCVTNPTYTRTTANGRVFYVCYDSTNKYVSLKVETSN